MQSPNLRPTLVRGLCVFGRRNGDVALQTRKRGFNGPVIACIQMEPHVEAKHDNVARAIGHIETAADKGASLVILPELANTGYVFADRDEPFSLAEKLPNGETAQIIVEAALRLGIYIVAGIKERAKQASI
jgi:N-carbamoylputrescine amidase